MAVLELECQNARKQSLDKRKKEKKTRLLTLFRNTVYFFSSSCIASKFRLPHFRAWPTRLLNARNNPHRRKMQRTWATVVGYGAVTWQNTGITTKTNGSLAEIITIEPLLLDKSTGPTASRESFTSNNSTRWPFFFFFFKFSPSTTM